MIRARAASTPVFAALFAFLLSGVVRPQDGGGMEEFEEVDPYTENDPEKMRALGYESYGPFEWLKGEHTPEVTEKIGAIPILWVETAHFRIGSSLNTYKIPGDRIEKDRLKDEIDRLRDKLGKLKAPKRELDPWLRLHLYAQRLEELYAAFLADFELTEADFADKGPHLGQKRKFRVLLAERKSEYARHAAQYLDFVNDSSYRFGWSGAEMGFATNDETQRGFWVGVTGVPFDSVLYASVASSMAQVFVDAYRANDYGAPEWLRRGYSHFATRRFDERYMTDAGYLPGQNVGDDDWVWEPRVSNLVKNDFFVSTADAFAWTRETKLNKRDHLIAWSRVDYLLREAEGDRAAFLRAVCLPPPKGAPDVARNALVMRQSKALQDAFGVTPDELDEAWAEWVDDEYEKD